MMSFKQLEAIYWVVKLGGFSQAAEKLHTTQSAISRRVQELESLLDTSLFDRSSRAARLTEKGQQTFAIAKRLLAQRDEAMEQLAQAQVVERRLRIGLTELTAMTWFPRLVGMMQVHHPRVVLEPDVDGSVTIRKRLLADEIDLAIVPDAEDDSRITKKAIGKVVSAWMCKPGLLPADRTLRLHELASHRILTQGSRSGAGLASENWFKSFGLTPKQSLPSNSIIAIIGMTVSGIGISPLPRDCLAPMVDLGLLQPIKVTPAIPDITYVAMSRSEQRSTLIDSTVLLAQECCDFTQVFQPGAIPADAPAPPSY
ncbi:HTH-type transcriptional regulator BenM [compost metagenome]